MRTAPERPLSFAFADAASLLACAHRTLENSKKLHDDIAANVSIETASFANVIRPLIDDMNRASCFLQITGGLLSSVSPDVSLRNASREADKIISNAQNEALLRCDMATLINAAYDREKKEEAKDISRLDRQDWTLLQRLHGQYARSGSALPAEKLDRLRTLRAELKQICLDAVQMMSEADDGAWFTRAELNGLPPEELAELQLNKPPQGHSDDDHGHHGHEIHKTAREDRFWVSFRSATTILRDATSSLTRKKLDIATDRRFPANVQRLQKAIALRDEIARLLGFRHHADLKFQEEMMSSSVEETISTLQEMERRLRPWRDREIEEVLSFKKRYLDSENRTSKGGEENPLLYAWDWSFYAKQIPQVNTPSPGRAKLREYFETNHTLKQMLRLFERLFGMEFIQVQELQEGSVWHESVAAYQVWSSSDQGDHFLGWLYTDVFNREGKYQNAHHLKIRPGFIEADGTRHYPASALICNFNPSSASQPSLLSHAQVTLMFHELGHAIHNLVSRTKYAIPHSRDYIEIPSVMLEHWTWNADVLIAIGKHYSCLGQDVCVENRSSAADTRRASEGDDLCRGVLPRDLAEAVVSTKPLRKARLMLILLQRALFDLTIHSPSTRSEALTMDTTRIWNTTRQEIIGLALSGEPGEESLAHGGFSHLFRKYDAGFFSYIMCQAWSEDLYSHGFNPDEPFDEAAARRYKRLVLEPGSSVPEVEILEGFLGRKLSLDAFYATLSGRGGSGYRSQAGPGQSRRGES